MIRKLSMWLLVALVGGVLLAGCGSSSSSTGQTSSAPAATTTAPSSTGSDNSGSSSVPTGATAVAQCKQGVNAATTLPSSTKSKLEEICNKAGSGDAEAVRKAAREVCAELINASPIPAGSVKEKALASCRKK